MTIESLTYAVLPLKVIATGAALPSHCVASSALDSLLNKPIDYIEKCPSITHRFHTSNDINQAELAGWLQGTVGFDINTRCVNFIAALPVAAGLTLGGMVLLP